MNVWLILGGLAVVIVAGLAWLAREIINLPSATDEGWPEP